MSKVLVVYVLVGLCLVPPYATADTLIGSLPNISGPPPQYTSATFVSPVRFVRLHQWAQVHGYDYSHQGCAGQQYHITAQCLVNGVNIPWSGHDYTVNGYGECVEVYGWSNMIIDLGQPGAFQIEVIGGNSLGVGRVADLFFSVYADSAANSAVPMDGPASATTLHGGGVWCQFPQEITYSLGDEGPVDLSVFGLDGRTVATIVHETLGSGWHRASWNGVDRVGRYVPSGIYFCCLTSKTGILSTKAVVVR
jgi:hypothetical protein